MEEKDLISQKWERMRFRDKTLLAGFLALDSLIFIFSMLLTEDPVLCGVKLSRLDLLWSAAFVVAHITVAGLLWMKTVPIRGEHVVGAMFFELFLIAMDVVSDVNGFRIYRSINPRGTWLTYLLSDNLRSVAWVLSGTVLVVCAIHFLRTSQTEETDQEN